MNAKNALIFFGIFTIFAIGAVAVFFISRSKNDNTPTPKNAEFPSATTSTKSGGSLFDFFGFGMPQNGGQRVTSVSTSAPLTQNQYDYYSGTQYPAAPTKPSNQYPIAPTFDNTTGNPDTGYKPSPPASELKNKLKITQVSRVYSETDSAEKEYVVIQADQQNTVKVALTGLTLKSMITGAEYKIGEGSELYYRNVLNAGNAIFLAPGDMAYINTGNSPVGVSFKENLCTGYLEQYQKFNPTLQRSCPRIYLEGLPERPNALSDDCLDYIQRYQTCNVIKVSEETTVTNKYGRECFSFIQKTADYNFCVNKHQGDKDFVKKTWRVYLGKSQHIWRIKREWIRLSDPEGKVVAEFTY